HRRLVRALLLAVLNATKPRETPQRSKKTLAPVLELGKEPGAGVSPMVLDGCQRDRHHPGDLGHGQTGEEAALDQLGRRRVFLVERVEGLVEGFEVFG